MFISQHIEEANRDLGDVPLLVQASMGGTRHTYLFIPDFHEPYPIYEKVIREFVRCFDGKDTEMLIYIEQDDRLEEHKSRIGSILEKNKECNCLINIFTEKVRDERSLFKAADYYVTTRAKENVQRMCLAEFYNTECISGVDLPVFGLNNTDSTIIPTDLRSGLM
jgi:virginiamycin A acetyltransferase